MTCQTPAPAKGDSEDYQGAEGCAAPYVPASRGHSLAPAHLTNQSLLQGCCSGLLCSAGDLGYTLSQI